MIVDVCVGPAPTRPLAAARPSLGRSSSARQQIRLCIKDVQIGFNAGLVVRLRTEHDQFDNCSMNHNNLYCMNEV